MNKIDSFLLTYPVYGFLLITLIISSLSFVLMLKIPDAQSPESIKGLPIWLIAIWSPNMAAITVWIVEKKLVSNIRMAFSTPDFSWWMLLALVPFLIAGLLLFIEVRKGADIEWSNFKLNYLLPLLLINLFMGPLGEELGWRALLYPYFENSFGWLAGSLFVGVIWAIWHAPLWFVDSPQAKIPFWAFSINVILLSVLMSMIYNHSQGSILVVVLLHLTFNVSLGIIDILRSHSPDEFIINSLYIYVPMVVILVGIHEWTSVNKC